MQKILFSLFMTLSFAFSLYGESRLTSLSSTQFAKEWDAFLVSKEADRSQISKESYRPTEFALIETWGEQQYPRRRASIPGMDDRDFRWVPYVENKIQLSDGTEMSASYINFNWNEEDSFQHFIASHAPLATNIDLFWRMVWENEIEQIVMVTEITDGKKNLCVPYWPESFEKPLVLANGIEIKLVDEKWLLAELKENIQVRTFEVNYEGQNRTILHYWYHNWPDNTAPEQTLTLKALVNEVAQDKEILHSPAPILAHCAGGVGRTGCFLTAYHLTQCLEQGRPLPNIFDLTANLRWQRPKMVSKPEQYDFCYRIYNELQEQAQNLP